MPKDKLKNIIRVIKTDVINPKREILIHVSDTPIISLPYITKVIKKLGAKYFIHTGDFIDELKTSHPLFEMKDYERAIDKFVNKMRDLSIGDIYLVPGNHDILNILEKYKNEFNIVKEGSIIDISGVTFSVAHDYRNLVEIDKNDRVFYLYGHNRYRDKRENFLNGYCGINVIFIDNLKVYSIPYPFYVNIVRGKNRFMRIGL